MEYLSGRLLLMSHYVIGGYLPTNQNIKEFECLTAWMNYKDEDSFMRQRSTHRTQCIYFLHHIEIENLFTILRDMWTIYQNSNPYAKENDFVDNVLSGTNYELKKVIERDFTWIPFQNRNFEIFYHFDQKFIETPITDYIVDDGKDMVFFKQYYSAVLDRIERFDFKAPSSEATSELSINSYPNIFSKDGLKVYEYLTEYLGNRPTDQSYIYWKLSKEVPPLIHCSAKDFLEFIRTRGIEISKIKTEVDATTVKRAARYNNLMIELRQKERE